MLADPICCWDQSGMPVLLIERKRDGGAVIIRGGDVIRLSSEDVSRLHFTNPAQPDPQLKVKQARRDHDGQSSLRRELRHNPAALHTMAAQLGLPASAADELLRELFESVGETPPQPVLRRAKGGGEQAKASPGANALRCNGSQGFIPQIAPDNLSQVAAGVDPLRCSESQRFPQATAAGSPEAGLPPVEQRSAALRSEAMRDEALRSRLAAIRLKDLSASRCPRVRDGYAWFTRQQQVAAQAKTHCVTEMTVATL
jgi:hypothetical protein